MIRAERRYRQGCASPKRARLFLRAEPIDFPRSMPSRRAGDICFYPIWAEAPPHLINIDVAKQTTSTFLKASPDCTLTMQVRTWRPAFKQRSNLLYQRPC
ncbi:hypothetical protein AMC87_PD00281 (plasmid) [Rhizobium phaseoli]|nr:hypothetical protein AMC87_PD00281 [Rhizobium phaseoli]EGE59481.1 hypothetical protein RHECNPAF_2190083 [Rhizobium etli CNPAF512]